MGGKCRNHGMNSGAMGLSEESMVTYGCSDELAGLCRMVDDLLSRDLGGVKMVVSEHLQERLAERLAEMSIMELELFLEWYRDYYAEVSENEAKVVEGARKWRRNQVGFQEP